MGSKPSKSKRNITTQPVAENYKIIDNDDADDSHPNIAGPPALRTANMSNNNSSPASSKTGSPKQGPSIQGTPRQSHPTISHEVPSDTDVMISYSHVDKDVMKSLKENLTKSGLNVWVDVVGLTAGVDFLSKIGEAIIDSKTFITLLSENSIKSKYCQDELALAYISNKPIFPVSIKPAKELVPLMDTGMRLQLAAMKWIVINDIADFDAKFTELLDLLKRQMSSDKGRTSSKPEERPASANNERIRKAANRYRFYTRETSVKSNPDDLPPKFTEDPNEFWDRHFDDKLDITWQSFIDAMVKEYHEEMDETYSDDDQKWLNSVLYREMEVEDSDGLLDKTMYLNFCTIEEELLPLWRRVEDQARESYAMREVFDMKSSVRIQAIENLAKIKGPAVMDALRDLLEDLEPNVRAVAAISLAKTGHNDKMTVKKVLKTLNDKDRLVREAGCIALGRLKAVAAVPRLVHIWRNDVISTVRNAAELALNQIGGPEVEKAMHITRILTQEIRMLTERVDK